MVHTELNSIGLKSVTPEQAFQMQKKGWTIVDVRIEGDYDAAHPAGAINLPLYRFVQVGFVSGYVSSLQSACPAHRTAASASASLFVSTPSLTLRGSTVALRQGCVNRLFWICNVQIIQ